jgi:2-methylfumaryl-CoA hydratase
MTIEEADHVQATRLYPQHRQGPLQRARDEGVALWSPAHLRRPRHQRGLRAAYNGLENLLGMAAWNGGVHANPTFAGDTIYAFTEVLERAELPRRRDLGALRLRLTAVKNVDPVKEAFVAESKDAAGKPQLDPRVVLRLDYWGVMPRR